MAKLLNIGFYVRMLKTEKKLVKGWEVLEKGLVKGWEALVVLTDGLRCLSLRRWASKIRTWAV